MKKKEKIENARLDQSYIPINNSLTDVTTIIGYDYTNKKPKANSKIHKLRQEFEIKKKKHIKFS